MKSNFNQQFQQQVQRQQQQQRMQGYAWQQQQKAKQGKQVVMIEPTPHRRRGFFYPFKWAGLFVIYMLIPGLIIIGVGQSLGAMLSDDMAVLGVIVGIVISLAIAVGLTNKVLNDGA